MSRLGKMSLNPKKSLGQNFLNSRQVIDAMIDTGAVDSRDIVLEIGPGKGILTESLLACARYVIAVEKDPRMVMYLSFKFKREIEAGKLKLIEGDALAFDPASEQLQSGGYKIIANIPYYLTGQFLRYFLGHPVAQSRAVLLLQKEVVRRIVADDGKESILSVSVKAYGTPSFIQAVPAELFTPRPRVDSAVLLIRDISKGFFKHTNEDRFFEVLRAGFAQKRKKLASNLAKLASKEDVAGLFEKLSIPENARAEELRASKWRAIAQALQKA